MDNQLTRSYFVLFLCSLCWFTSSFANNNTLATASNFKQLQAAQFIGDGKLPQWVVNNAIPQDYDIPQNTIRDGTYYVLVDEQTRINGQREVTEFHRYVTHVVNQKGIEHNAQIQISFDPVYEHVVLHRLQVIRNGQVSDKLSETTFSVLHNEDEPAAQLYNGKRKLQGIVADLRTGDLLDYSYSIIGNNPVFDGAFGGSRSMQWGIPVERLSLSFSAPVDLPLQFSAVNIDAKIQESVKNEGESGDYKFYLYQQDNIAPVYTDKDYPAWYTAWPKLFVTTRNSWQEVADWGVNLFAVQSGRDSAGIDNLVNDIRATSDDIDIQIANAIQFVQNEVRYYGIELGENSHRPSFADETLERRFGDCKDKSVLLLNLLHKLGVQATPALVNSDAFAELPNIVASEAWFDHVVVQIQHNDKTYWIDPTREMQFGTLDDMYQVDFGNALVLQAGETELTVMNGKVVADWVLNDVWDLSAGRKQPAKFTTHNIFSGLDAEEQRNRIANEGVFSIQNSYLEHYQNYYKRIKKDGQMETDDNRENNRISIKQSYLVEEFWDESEREFNANFYSEGINYLLNEPRDTDRTLPLLLSYPEKITQNIDIYLHDLSWSFDEEANEVNNAWFSFKQTSRFDAEQNLLQLSYAFEHHQDHVPVNELDAYIAALKEARKIKNYGIVEYKKNDEESLVTSPKPQETRTSNQILWDETGHYFIGFLVWFGALLLYWILRIRERNQSPYQGEVQYFPVSTQKLMLLGVLTGGFYFMYWFYRNFKWERQHKSSKVIPILRGIFYPLFYYSLFKSLVMHLKGTIYSGLNYRQDEQTSMVPEAEQNVQLPGYAIFFTILILALWGLSTFVDHWIIASLVLTGLLLLPMAKRISKANEHNDAQNYNSKWRPRHLLLLVIFGPMTVYFFAYDLALLPDTKVVQGETLYTHDVRYMLENDVIAPEEEIVWFYSADMFTVRNDGNGVTNSGIFSYWRDEEDALVIEKALYQDIADIQIHWSDSSLDNTIIEVRRNDGNLFELHVSTEDGLDKTFVNFLNRRWKPFR